MIKNDIDCVYGNLKFVDANDTNKIVRTWVGSQHTPGAFMKGWHPAHPTFYVRREVYEKYGLYDTSYKVAVDYEFMIRFLKNL